MSDADILAERAARYHELILDVARGPGGMIISFSDLDTHKPRQETDTDSRIWGEQFLPAWKDSLRPTAAEVDYGENTLWATGWFLWSQILCYRATQEEEALETARKCFRDLNNIFRLCRQFEPGLLGKPHGGRAGPGTSFDQSACPVLFYVIYAQEMATPEEKAAAVENMALHGDFYFRRNWVMNHHGTLVSIVPARHTSVMKYLACVHAAYEMTGERKYRDAAFKYMRQLIAGGQFPFPGNPYDINHNHFYYGLLCDYWNKTEIADEADWGGYINAYWQAMQAALDKEGLVRQGHYDTTTRTFTPYPDRWVYRDEAHQFPFLGIWREGEKRRWVSSTCHGNNTLNFACSAALALLARAHGLDNRAHEAAKRTLLRMDEDTLRRWWNEATMPEEIRPVDKIFAPEVPAVWLVAYWMGRLQKVW